MALALVPAPALAPLALALALALVLVLEGAPEGTGMMPRQAAPAPRK